MSQPATAGVSPTRVIAGFLGQPPGSAPTPVQIDAMRMHLITSMSQVITFDEARRELVAMAEARWAQREPPALLTAETLHHLGTFLAKPPDQLRAFLQQFCPTDGHLLEAIRMHPDLVAKHPLVTLPLFQSAERALHQFFENTPTEWEARMRWTQADILALLRVFAPHLQTLTDAREIIDALFYLFHPRGVSSSSVMLLPQWPEGDTFVTEVVALFHVSQRTYVLNKALAQWIPGDVSEVAPVPTARLVQFVVNLVSGAPDAPVRVLALRTLLQTGQWPGGLVARDLAAGLVDGCTKPDGHDQAIGLVVALVAEHEEYTAKRRAQQRAIRTAALKQRLREWSGEADASLTPDTGKCSRCTVSAVAVVGPCGHPIGCLTCTRHSLEAQNTTCSVCEAPLTTLHRIRL